MFCLRNMPPQKTPIIFIMKPLNRYAQVLSHLVREGPSSMKRLRRVFWPPFHS